MKTISWETFLHICKQMDVRFENDDGDELVRDADEFGVDLYNIDTGQEAYFSAEMNTRVDVDGNDITLINDDYALIISVFIVAPFNFD